VSAPAPDAPTYAACLTPPGTGAIAVLALHGPRAWSVARDLFRPRSARQSLPDSPEPGRFWLGKLGDEAADEVVLVAKLAGVEVHCHGGVQVVRMLLELFERRGITVCPWRQFNRLTGDNALRSTAAAALAEARTVRTAAILLDQYQGAFERAVETSLAAMGRNDAAETNRLLAELARHTGVGRHLTTPWWVAVAGAPNVGKSSLVNALAGYQRSIVSPSPGTTRDVVTTTIAVDGWPVELADTAGLREGAQELEGEGIDRAREAAAGADLCLWVLDAAATPVWPSAGLHLPLAPNVRLVVNKTDLPAAWDLDEATGALRVSAKTGDGIPELCDGLARWLVAEAPPPGASVPFTPDLCSQVEEARRSLSQGDVANARRILTSEPPG
jgi:tRNA modification GTPase